MIFMSPAITMRLIAEEQKLGTLELLLTSPLREFEVIIGKFIAAFFLIFIMIWVRWTVPRLRVDQLMHVCWKVFIPIAMLNIFGVGIWKLIIG